MYNVQEQHFADFKKYEAEKATRSNANASTSLHHRTGTRLRLGTAGGTRTTGTGTQENDHEDQLVTKKKRQVPIDIAIGKLHVLTQAEFENSLVEMLVEDMQPLATVERPGFRKFCRRCIPQVHLMSRRTAGRRLDAMYDEAKTKFINELTKVRWMSCTADLWSSHKRSYIGVTVHYIDSKVLEMRSAVLSCRRFKGSHTGNEIGLKLQALFKEFKIANKIQNVVTDNAANFAKAFSLFQAAVV